MSDNRSGYFRKFSKLILLLLVLLFFSHPPVHAEWSIYKRALLRNNDGNQIRFDTSSAGIRIMFFLRKKDNGVFADRLPSYRIDGHEVYRIEKGKSEYPGLRVSKNRWVRWTISGKEEFSPRLEEFMNGQEAVFQYYRKNGQIVETIFNLKGAREAILEISE